MLHKMPVLRSTKEGPHMNFTQNYAKGALFTYCTAKPPACQDTLCSKAVKLSKFRFG